MAAFKTYGPKKGVEGLTVEVNVPRAQLVDDKGNALFDKDGNAVYDRGEGEALRLGGDDGHEFPFQARTGAEEAALGAHPLLEKSDKKAKGGGGESLKAKDNGGES
jgi:hypothetical protein